MEPRLKFSQHHGHKAVALGLPTRVYDAFAVPTSRTATHVREKRAPLFHRRTALRTARREESGQELARVAEELQNTEKEIRKPHSSPPGLS